MEPNNQEKENQANTKTPDHRERHNRENNRKNQNENIKQKPQRNMQQMKPPSHKFIKKPTRKYYQQYIFIVQFVYFLKTVRSSEKRRQKQ